MFWWLYLWCHSEDSSTNATRFKHYLEGESWDLSEEEKTSVLFIELSKLYSKFLYATSSSILLFWVPSCLTNFESHIYHRFTNFRISINTNNSFLWSEKEQRWSLYNNIWLRVIHKEFRCNNCSRMTPWNKLIGEKRERMQSSNSFKATFLRPEWSGHRPWIIIIFSCSESRVKTTYNDPSYTPYR